MEWRGHSLLLPFFRFFILSLLPLALSSSSSFPPKFNDPLYDSQWHLHNWQTPSDPDYSLDTGVTRIWEDTQGSGVTIGFVVPDAVYNVHADLKANYRVDLSFPAHQRRRTFAASSSSTSSSFSSSTSSSSSSSPRAVPSVTLSSIAVAVASANNKICGVGVSPKTHFTALSVPHFLSPSQDQDLSLSLSHENDDVDIYCLLPSSPLSSSSFPFISLGPNTTRALGGRGGRKGKGNVFVVPLTVRGSGRGGEKEPPCNHNGLVMSSDTMAVGSVSFVGHRSLYSPLCSAVHVVAPSNGNEMGIVTIDGIDKCTKTYEGGTETSAAYVAGSIALIISAFPHLTFRDISHILAVSSLQIDSIHGEWVTNAAGVSHSRKYGFGLINVHSALTHAREWGPSLADALTYTHTSDFVTREVSILDMASAEFDVFCDYEMNIEKVSLELNLIHDAPGDIRVSLTSPSGTKSVLADIFGIEKRDVSLIIEGTDPFPLVEIDLGPHFPLDGLLFSILSLPSPDSSLLNCSSPSNLSCGCDTLYFHSPHPPPPSSSRFSPPLALSSRSFPHSPPPSPYYPEILLLARGLCPIETQVRNGERIGSKAVIIIEDSEDDPPHYSGDGWNVGVPSGRMGKIDGERLLQMVSGQNGEVKGRIVVSVTKTKSVTPYPMGWNFTSLAFWGEKCAGKWNVVIEDAVAGESGSIHRGLFHAFGFKWKDQSTSPMPSPSPSSPPPSPSPSSPPPSLSPSSLSATSFDSRKIFPIMATKSVPSLSPSLSPRKGDRGAATSSASATSTSENSSLSSSIFSFSFCLSLLFPSMDVTSFSFPFPQ